MSESAEVRRAATGVMMGHYPYRFCGLCGARIHWVKTRKSGKMMPCELELKRGDGKMTLVCNDGVVRARAGEDVFGYEPHFGHCREYKRILQVRRGNDNQKEG